MDSEASELKLHWSSWTGENSRKWRNLTTDHLASPQKDPEDSNHTGTLFRAQCNLACHAILVLLLFPSLTDPKSVSADTADT